MNLLKQKSVVDKVMNKIFPIAPNAIVAGGAPRDWFFGKVARDVDIFLYRPDLVTTSNIIAVFSSIKLNLHYLEFLYSENGDRTGHGTYISNPLISHVLECTYSGVNFQFIFMTESTFTSVVPHFPLNMSRIWYKDGELHPTGEFLHGVNTKSLIKMDEIYADGHTYIDKIRKYFPDYRYFSSVEEYFVSTNRFSEWEWKQRNVRVHTNG